MAMHNALADRGQMVERIVEGLSAGTPLRELCRQDGMPAWRTVYDWLEADPDFATRFARAREMGFDAIAEEALEIADDGSNDWMERRRKDGSTEEVVNSEHVQRSKLRIETRLKLLAKWSPKRYGDKQTHAIGGDPDAPAVQVEHGVDADTLAALSKAILNQPQGK
jgi:predicted secreted protein